MREWAKSDSRFGFLVKNWYKKHIPDVSDVSDVSDVTDVTDVTNGRYERYGGYGSYMSYMVDRIPSWFKAVTNGSLRG